MERRRLRRPPVDVANGSVTLPLTIGAVSHIHTNAQYSLEELQGKGVFGEMFLTADTGSLGLPYGPVSGESVRRTLS